MKKIKAKTFIKGKFAEYYKKYASTIPSPTSIEKREFGFLLLKEKIMLRHKSFRNVDDLREFLKKTVPSDVYYSGAYYERPEEEMEEKVWLGADLIFDIDADHIRTPCDKIHDKWTCNNCGFVGKGATPEKCPVCGEARFDQKTWMCEVCLESAKRETMKLVEVLMDDFGFPSEKIKVGFSVTGDTPILVRDGNEGQLVQIKDAIDLLKRGRKLEVLSINKEGKVLFSGIHGYLEHEDEVYEVYYQKSNLPIGLTGYHSVFIFDEEGRMTPKKVSELKVGDFLITFNDLSPNNQKGPKQFRFSYTMWKRKREGTVNLTEDLMRLIGYYLAEGSVTGSKVSFAFNSEEKNFIQDCSELIRRILGKKPCFHHTNPSTLQISFGSKKWASFFKKACGKSVLPKHIPSFVWAAPRSFILELLKGYFRGDAHISRYAVRAKSRSKYLIPGLTWLCKLNGIACSIYEREDKGRMSPQGVWIKGGKYYEFFTPRTELFGEFGRIRSKCTPYPKEKTLPTQPLWIVYQQMKPGQFNEHRRERSAFQKKRINVYKVATVLKWLTDHYKTSPNNKSKTIIDNYGKILNNAIGVVRVTKIIKGTRNKVYDITVKGTEAFFGGYYPILLHNSGHRGYHLHLESEEILSLDSMARKEIVDYIAGIGLEPEFHGLEKISGPKLDDSGWRGRIARGTYDFLLQATPEKLEEIGLQKRVINIIERHKERLIKSWREEGPWGIIGIKGSRKIAQFSVQRQSVKIDTVVTTDIHRLIRLTNTLHGKTGLKKTEVPITKLERFDPFKSAVAFKEGTVTVLVSEAPQLRLGDEIYGPYEEQKIELPTAVAMLLLCKGAARLVE